MAEDSFEYTCGSCGKRCISSKPLEAADAEAEELFGVKSASKDPNMAIVCDHCFQEWMRWLDEKGS